MKRKFAFVALMMLIAVAIHLYLNPKPPARARTIVAPANQNSSPSRTNSSSGVDFIAISSAASKATATSASPSPSREPVPAPQAGQWVADTSAQTEVGPATALQNVRRAVHQYGEMFGGNPVGTNPEITSQLTGENPKRINFLNPQPGMHIDADGELVDQWGTP